MGHRESRSLWLVLALCFFGSAISHAADRMPPIRACGYPEDVQARIEIRDRQLRNLAPRELGGMSLESVVDIVRKWKPGQTLTVAFLDGDEALRKDIENAAAEWSKRGNIKLDFRVNGKFREWSAADAAFAADVRISFDRGGYWSLVGTDSNNAAVVDPNQPSMNFGGFLIERPADWRGTVIHEFGHAFGFQHEHQHPGDGCDNDFRWNDDPGYIPKRDQFGQFVPDDNGKRPGIYTVLGGPPNKWSQAKVDHNLRQLPDSHAYEVSPFDKQSIMKYYFPAWMFVDGAQSHCYTATENETLSARDAQGIAAAYPSAADKFIDRIALQRVAVTNLLSVQNLRPETQEHLKNQIRRLDAPQ